MALRAGIYGNSDMILNHISRGKCSYATYRHTPCNMLYSCWTRFEQVRGSSSFPNALAFSPTLNPLTHPPFTLRSPIHP